MATFSGLTHEFLYLTAFSWVVTRMHHSEGRSQASPEPIEWHDAMNRIISGLYHLYTYTRARHWRIII